MSFGAILCVEGAKWFAVSRHQWDPMIAIGVARLFEIILISLIILIWEKGLLSIGLARSKMIPGLKKGLIWSASFGVLALFGFIVLYIADVNFLPLIRTPLPTKQNDILFLFLIGGIVAPVAEEIFFRGVLYGFFRRWGVIMALVLSTLVFVLAHPIGHSLPVIQLVGGILFAIAYEVERSLLVPITIHAIGNISIFTLSLLF